MKSRIILLASALLLLTFSSCEIPYEPAADDSASASLLGEWQMETLEYAGSASQTITGMGTLEYDIQGEALNINATSTFTEAPNQLINNGTFDLHMSYVMTSALLPSPISFEDNQTNLPNEPNGTWTLDGDQLTILPDGGIASTLTILELTAHSLKLNGDVVMNFALPDATGGIGVAQDITINQTVTYTR